MGVYYCHHCDHYKESREHGCEEDPNNREGEFDMICEECHIEYLYTLEQERLEASEAAKEDYYDED